MDIDHLIHQYGYWAVGLFCFLEGETVLILAGFACRLGHLDLATVIGLAAVCGWMGDQTYFWIGRVFGSQAISRWPSIARHAGRVQELIERYAYWVVLLVRFAYGLRIAGPILIGTSRLGVWRFAAFNGISAVIWASGVASAGWAFGAALQRALGSLHDIEVWIFGGLVAAGTTAWAIGNWRARRRPVVR
jgi:membrane protein DedA with SNARE-associated domain